MAITLLIRSSLGGINFTREYLPDDNTTRIWRTLLNNKKEANQFTIHLLCTLEPAHTITSLPWRISIAAWWWMDFGFFSMRVPLQGPVPKLPVLAAKIGTNDSSSIRDWRGIFMTTGFCCQKIRIFCLLKFFSFFLGFSSFYSSGGTNSNWKWGKPIYT